jgi:hypothetical protein
VLRRGGYGKLVQRELEVQRQLVDYGAGSLGSFPAVMPPPHCKCQELFYLKILFLNCTCNSEFFHLLSRMILVFVYMLLSFLLK